MGVIFRVMLAGHDVYDLERAAKILSGREDVLVTIANTHAATLTALPHVDVAICQVKAPGGSAEDVDAFALLQASQTPSHTPIAVILDGQSAADTMATAVQLGALDILQAPISEQSDRLLFHVEKWKHTLPRKEKDAKELSSGQESDCSPEVPVPRIELMPQLDTDSLDELFGSATSSDTMFNGDWAQSEALAAEIMPHLFGGDDSFSGQPAFGTGFDALASCETELYFNQLGDDTSQTQPSGSSDGSVSYLPLGRQTSLATCSAPAMGKRKSEEFIRANVHTSNVELMDDARYKKQKVEWTAELHNVFVAVVERIGVDIAVPSQILTAMGKHAKGLTRQNVASHLQKYRNRSRASLTTTSYGSAPPAGVVDAATCSFLPVAQPAALPAAPCWATLNTGLSPAYPLGTAECARWPAPTLLAAAPAPAAMQPSPQLLASIQAAIRAPQGRLPIGLKLDASAVMTSWKAAAKTSPCCNTHVQHPAI